MFIDKTSPLSNVLSGIYNLLSYRENGNNKAFLNRLQPLFESFESTRPRFEKEAKDIRPILGSESTGSRDIRDVSSGHLLNFNILLIPRINQSLLYKFMTTNTIDI